jgi:hypothetical protein
MSVGPALLVKLGFKHIEKRSRLAVRVAGLLKGKAAGDLLANQSNPFICDKTDTSNAAVIVLVGVCKTENSFDTHEVRPALEI